MEHQERIPTDAATLGASNIDVSTKVVIPQVVSMAVA
jgi:hypothetical protein